SGTGGTSGTGGASGSGGSGGDASTCDTSKSPAEEACLVDDQHAVFVNGTVSTTGTGTKASPYKTIGEAVKAAGTKLIVVCDTTYDEQLTLTSGVKLFGGFACSDWSYETGKRASVKPKKGVALDITGVSATVVIEDLELASADASAAGESSVAATIATSSDVKLRRVKLVAGKGQAGANGALAAFTYPAQSALNGNSASGLAGGAVKQCACPAGNNSIGGAGASGPTPKAGDDGFPALGAGQGGVPGSCSVGLGKDGAPASPAAPAAGASTLGTLTGTTWSPSKAPNASPGGPGQGGGGGASSASGGGGGGGCGGCGGAGGPGGGGGGASIALVAVDSTVSMDAGSELVTSDAGNGGSGAAGQAGQTDIGFAGNPGAGGCMGGAGGKGADGGAGGGGAGGISVAAVWKDTQPTIDGSAKITLGKKGNKGPGGKAGSNDGIDGVAQSAFEVK
ncbi:MAG: hypothetical protein IT375_33015, partial [Polyangiaceae bacterium]|nr:hypothetical protein [Polyangiaceae bacterium]